MRVRTYGWLALVVVAAVAVAIPLAASQARYVSGETITFANTAIGFTEATITRTDGTQASECVGRLETAQIRVTWNGTTPTTTVGMLVEIGDTLMIKGHENLMKFRGIRTGATSGVIQFQCGVQ